MCRPSARENWDEVLSISIEPCAIRLLSRVKTGSIHQHSYTSDDLRSDSPYEDPPGTQVYVSLISQNRTGARTGGRPPEQRK